MISDEVPEGRCGFVLSPEEVYSKDSYMDMVDWYKENNGVCCWRETWEKANKCIWHAERLEKSAEDLPSVVERISPRLDGTKIPNIDVDKDSSFINYRFIGSIFVYANLEGVNLYGSNLQYSDLEGVNLQQATLNETNLRKSHLKGGAKLEKASIRNADLRNAELENAYLNEADLWESDLRGANLKWANLKKAHLWNAKLQDCNLYDAKLEEADLRRSGLKSANLEDASLIRTDLREANLENAHLYQTYFSDVRINSDTEFGDTCIYENPDELDDDWDEQWDATPTEAAVWTYRRLQDLHKKYALTERARHYHVKKKESQKRRHREEGNYLQYAIHAVNGIASRHGESPWRVVGVSGVVIAIWSVLYLLLGKIRVPTNTSSTDTIGLGLFPSLSPPTPISEILTSVYFSVVTFTTLGYGNLQPATGFAQALATVESFIGALLMAYLVFVLGRRTNW